MKPFKERIKDSISKRNWLELDDYERKNQLDININNYNNFTSNFHFIKCYHKMYNQYK